MSNPLLYVIMETIYADWMMGITSFICLWCVFNILLPKTKTKRKIVTLVIIELFEHLVVPIVMFILLLFTQGFWQGLLFNGLILSFIFGFIGSYLVRAKSAEDWFRMLIVCFFVYLFVVFYPFILVFIQLHIQWITGTEIVLITNGLFIISYIIYKFILTKNGR